MKAIGLDIGTTTICGVLVDAVTGELIKKQTLPNDSAIEGEMTYEKLQDPWKIREICGQIILELIGGTTELVSIGVTGQMHGILYLNDKGEPVSPLMTWQDGRGDEMYQDKKSYAAVLSEKTGYRLATGYGAVTHYYQTVNSLIPKDAVTFCTIADYIAMFLAGREKPVLHASMAASLGLYRIKEQCFDVEMIKTAGMSAAYFPEVLSEEKSIGQWGKQVEISPAIGDNQASFLGSVDKESKILVNVGTGSQISILGEKIRDFKGLECRPFAEGKVLYVGSSLCGGDSYAMLKNFFKEVLRLKDQETGEELYEVMNAAGYRAKEAKKELFVDTRFRGSRENPALRGKIEGISPDNFTPGAMVLGVLKGIVTELWNYAKEMEDPGVFSYMAGSGNGIRKNPLLRELFAECFGKTVKIPRYAEEASYGSAMFSVYTAGKYKTLEQLQEKVILEEGYDT